MKRDDMLYDIYKKLQTHKSTIKTFIKYLIFFAIVVLIYIAASNFIYNAFDVGSGEERAVSEPSLPDPPKPNPLNYSGPSVKARELRISSG